MQDNSAVLETSFTTGASWSAFIDSVSIQKFHAPILLPFSPCHYSNFKSFIDFLCDALVENKVKDFGMYYIISIQYFIISIKTVVSLDSFSPFWPTGNPRSLSGSWAQSGHCFLKEIQPRQNSWDASVAFIPCATEYEIWHCHWRQLYNASCKHNLRSVQTKWVLPLPIAE